MLLNQSPSELKLKTAEILSGAARGDTEMLKALKKAVESGSFIIVIDDLSLLLGDVQRRTLVSSGGTTFLVDRLEKRGLVERRLCETDRRARYAALTPAGTALMVEIFPAHAEAIRRAMSGLGLADQREATDLLRVLGREASALSLPGD